MHYKRLNTLYIVGPAIRISVLLFYTLFLATMGIQTVWMYHEGLFFHLNHSRCIYVYVLKLRRYFSNLLRATCGQNKKNVNNYFSSSSILRHSGTPHRVGLKNEEVCLGRFVADRRATIVQLRNTTAFIVSYHRSSMRSSVHKISSVMLCLLLWMYSFWLYMHA